jgi:hypothetical protein
MLHGLKTIALSFSENSIHKDVSEVTPNWMTVNILRPDLAKATVTALVMGIQNKFCEHTTYQAKLFSASFNLQL